MFKCLKYHKCYLNIIKMVIILCKTKDRPISFTHIIPNMLVEIVNVSSRVFFQFSAGF